MVMTIFRGCRRLLSPVGGEKRPKKMTCAVIVVLEQVAVSSEHMYDLPSSSLDIDFLITGINPVSWSIPGSMYFTDIQNKMTRLTY